MIMLFSLPLLLCQGDAEALEDTTEDAETDAVSKETTTQAKASHEVEEPLENLSRYHIGLTLSSSDLRIPLRHPLLTILILPREIHRSMVRVVLPQYLAAS